MGVVKFEGTWRPAWLGQAWVSAIAFFFSNEKSINTALEDNMFLMLNRPCATVRRIMVSIRCNSSPGLLQLRGSSLPAAELHMHYSSYGTEVGRVVAWRVTRLLARLD